MFARAVLMKLKPGCEVELTNCDSACLSLGRQQHPGRSLLGVASHSKASS